MKKRKLGILASAIATCAVCICMIAGATFALFTSNDSVNIAVTSGNVKITAEVVPGESSSTLGDKTALGKFNTSNGFALENIVPGDIYSFTVKANNQSSVNVLYRTKIELTNELLASALDVTIDGVKYSGLTKWATKWTETEGEIADLNVEIAFPASEESQNRFQNLSTDIKVTVEGVQANASVNDESREIVFSVNNGVQLEDVVGTAKEEEATATINLVDDIVLPNELYIDEHTAELTINGNGHEITAVKEFAMINAGQYQLIKVNSTEHLVTFNDVTLKHVAIDTQKSSYHTLDVYASKVALNNVTLIRDFESVKGGAALVINGAEVTATDLQIIVGGSAWGGINVDGKNGNAVLTLNGGFDCNNVAVWCENGGTVVDVENVLMSVGSDSYVVPAATVNGTKYAKLDEAIEALEEGDELNIVKAGEYPALIIATKGVTVNGLLGEDKAHSAVFNGLVAKAENVTFNDIYVEYSAGYDNGYSTKTGATYNHCTFVGNGASTALYVHVPEITITDCTFENWGSALYTCGDNHAAKKIVIDGNTFVNVNSPFDGYWGKAADTSVQYNIEFTNNTITNDNGVAYVQLWDYTQWLNSSAEDRIGSAVRALVSGNTGAFDLYLTHFDYLWETTENCTIELGEGQKTVYRSFVAFEIEGNHADYEIRNTDGSALTTYNAMTAINRKNGDMKGCYACCTGTYILVNKTTGETVCTFTVTDPTVGTTQTVTVA